MMLFIHIHIHIHRGVIMAGQFCPKCSRQTFFKTATGRKCSKCTYEMRLPANNGKGGKGTQCSNCGQFTVFNNNCRNENCGAVYIENKS